jgi:hypothetical protein
VAGLMVFVAFRWAASVEVAPHVSMQTCDQHNTETCKTCACRERRRFLVVWSSIFALRYLPFATCHVRADSAVVCVLQP